MTTTTIDEIQLPTFEEIKDILKANDEWLSEHNKIEEKELIESMAMDSLQFFLLALELFKDDEDYDDKCRELVNIIIDTSNKAK